MSTTSSAGSASTAWALGSDYDGALVPAEIGDAAGLQNLVAGLERGGYGKSDIRKICLENWLRVLRERPGAEGRCDTE